MGLRRRDVDSAAALAAELGRAKENFEATRADVIARSATRQQHLQATIAELRAEHEEHERIVTN